MSQHDIQPVEKYYGSRYNSWIDTVNYMIWTRGGHVIWYLHVKEIYGAQNSGIDPYTFAENILAKYKQ